MCLGVCGIEVAPLALQQGQVCRRVEVRPQHAAGPVEVHGGPQVLLRRDSGRRSRTRPFRRCPEPAAERRPSGEPERGERAPGPGGSGGRRRPPRGGPRCTPAVRRSRSGPGRSRSRSARGPGAAPRPRGPLRSVRRSARANPWTRGPRRAAAASSGWLSSTSRGTAVRSSVDLARIAPDHECEDVHRRGVPRRAARDRRAARSGRPRAASPGAGATRPRAGAGRAKSGPG